MNKIKYLILLIILISFTVFGQNKNDYKSIHWKTFHKVGFANNINCKTDTWKQMKISEKEELKQIPDAELNNMSTEDLVLAHINSVYTRSLFLYSSIQDYYNKVLKFNGTVELLNRLDAFEKIIDFYNSINVADKSKSESGLPSIIQMQFCEYLIGNPALLSKFSMPQLVMVGKSVMHKYTTKSAVKMSDVYKGNFEPSSIYALAKILETLNVDIAASIQDQESFNFLIMTGRIGSPGIIDEILTLADTCLE